MAIEIVDFPMKNGGSFHSYVKLPEGIHAYAIASQTSKTEKHIQQTLISQSNSD